VKYVKKSDEKGSRNKDQGGKEKIKQKEEKEGNVGRRLV